VSFAEPDAELLMDLNRALRQSIVSVELGSGRDRRIAENERLLKAVAKQLARQAGDLVDDRKSREAIRISVYNTLAPVLLEMRDRVERTMTVARRTMIASVVVVAAVAAVTFLH
jgi:hypothetical protein